MDCLGRVEVGELGCDRDALRGGKLIESADRARFNRDRRSGFGGATERDFEGDSDGQSDPSGDVLTSLIPTEPFDTPLFSVSNVIVRSTSIEYEEICDEFGSDFALIRVYISINLTQHGIIPHNQRFLAIRIIATIE